MSSIGLTIISGLEHRWVPSLYPLDATQPHLIRTW